MTPLSVEEAAGNIVAFLLWIVWTINLTKYYNILFRGFYSKRCCYSWCSLSFSVGSNSEQRHTAYICPMFWHIRKPKNYINSFFIRFTKKSSSPSGLQHLKLNVYSASSLLLPWKPEVYMRALIYAKALLKVWSKVQARQSKNDQMMISLQN